MGGGDDAGNCAADGADDGGDVAAYHADAVDGCNCYGGDWVVSMLLF